MTNVEPIVKKEIVEQFMHGSEEAFTVIFNEYKKKVYFMAYYFFYDEQKAEDIVQDTFIKVYKSAGQLKTPETLHVWINKIAYHTCIEKSRRKKFSIVEGDDVTTIEDFADDYQESAMDVLDQKEIKQAIMKGINELSIPLKSVALLRFYEELSIDDIADILDISTNVVNVRINRAKKELKKYLEEQEVSPRVFKAAVHPIAFVLAFQALASTTQMPQIDVNSIVKVAGSSVGALGIATKLKSLLAETPAKVAIGVVATSAVVAGAVYVNEQNHEVKPQVKEDVQVKSEDEVHNETIVEDKHEDEGPSATILDVTYNMAYTNQAITLNVSTSDQNYDKILVNNQESLEITHNGTYEITLWRGSNQIDSRTINVTNIDTEAPVQVGVYQEGNLYFIQYMDSLSQIDANSIEVYQNGERYWDYSFDASSGVLQLTTNQDASYMIFVGDYAGNFTSTVSSK